MMLDEVLRIATGHNGRGSVLFRMNVVVGTASVLALSELIGAF